MKRMACAAVLVMLVIGSLNADAHLNPKDIRLTRKVWPQFYNLYITTSVCEDKPNFLFYGQVDINVQVKIATSTIKINAKQLNITFSETTLRPVDTNELIPVYSQNLDEEHEFLIIQFPETLCASCVYVLHIKFQGILRTDLRGYYRSGYTDKISGVRKWLALTQFQITDARRAFPCFDEPEYKATFKIHLGRPRSCTALSNMPLITTHNIEGLPDWVMDEFDITKRMPTYLVAWAVSEFQCANSLSGGRIRVCSRPDSLIHSDLALSVGPAALQYYEKYFDVAYPLPKSDMIAVPDLNVAAMENWGLITYREEILLFDASSATLTAKYKIAHTVSHELAHQWFGNLVTMKWWSDIWLNEGFATFVASLGVQNAFPHWNSRDVEAVEELLSVSSLDSLVSSHAIFLNISHPNEIIQMSDDIYYKKGSLLLRMMSLFLGQEVFRQGVINYLKKYQYGNAETDDLYHELTKEARKQRVLSKSLTLKEIMDSWTLQTGHPVVIVRREGVSLILSQKRFLFYRIARTRLASVQQACWYIPITITTESLQDFILTKPLAWMKCDVPELMLTNVAKEGEWYILNVQAAGIYRVFYDLENWKALSKTLNSRHYKNIAVMNRVQILNDIMHFTWTGDIDADVAFRLIGYIRREAEFLPWRVTLHNLERVKNIFSRTIHYNVFMTWVGRLLKPAFERVGNPEPDDLQRTRHHEQLFQWACEMQIDTCIYQARVFFAQWMRSRNPARNDVIPIYLRSISTCISVKYGGEQEWEFGWNAYLSSDGSLKVEFLKALGCSSQPWILRRYLQWMLEQREIRLQDANHVFLSVLQNDVGFTIAKEFFETNIEKLTMLFGSGNGHFKTWISEMGKMMFTEEEYEEFTEFTDTNRHFLTGAEIAVSQSKEVIRDNIRWYKRNFPQYVAMMEKYKIRRVMN